MDENTQIPVVHLYADGTIVLKINDNTSVELNSKMCDEIIRKLKRAQSDSESIIKINKRKIALLNNYEEDR